MQIVIDIPENIYYKILNCEISSRDLRDMDLVIEDGIRLPKGHGNIYDENDIKKDIENPYQCQTVLYGLKLVKPIIEADKAESEEQA